MCLRHAARRHDDCRCGQGNKLQCPYCETPKRYRVTGRTADCPRSGRPRVTTPAQDLNITPAGQVQDGNKTARVTPGTHNLSLQCSVCPREAGLRACRPVVKDRSSPDITGNITDGHKPTVAVPDRTGKMCSSLTSHGFVSPVGDCLIHVNRRKNERDRFGGGGSVMVWGSVTATLQAMTTNLVQSQRCVLQGRHPHVVPFLQAHADMTLQHNNATSHTPNSVCDFL
jgi:hypothetical protein